jgi:uncharacterized membrane protein
LAFIEVVLCLVLFTACAMHVRIRLKAAKEPATVASSTSA